MPLNPRKLGLNYSDKASLIRLKKKEKLKKREASLGEDHKVVIKRKKKAVKVGGSIYSDAVTEIGKAKLEKSSGSLDPDEELR